MSVRERLPHERSETKAKRKRNSRKTDLRKLFVGRKDVIFESAVVVVKLGVAINGTKGHQQPTWFPTLNCSLQLFIVKTQQHIAFRRARTIVARPLDRVCV